MLKILQGCRITVGNNKRAVEHLGLGNKRFKIKQQNLL